jgi:hypothetical protein
LRNIRAAKGQILSNEDTTLIKNALSGLGVNPEGVVKPGFTKKEAVAALLGVDYKAAFKNVPEDILSAQESKTLQTGIKKSLYSTANEVFTSEEVKPLVAKAKQLNKDIDDLQKEFKRTQDPSLRGQLVEKGLERSSLQKQINEDVSKNIKTVAGKDFADTLGITDATNRKIKKTGDTLRESLYPLVKAGEKSGGFTLFDTFVGDLFLLQEVTYSLSMVTQTLGYVFVNTNAELEKYLTTLKTTLGTASEAKKVFQEFAQPFALEVPFFQTADLIGAVNKLAAEGFSSQEITGNLDKTGAKYKGSLVKSIVDAAAAFGTSPENAVDAFISATQNRFTRIRQFGISRADLEAFGFAGNNEDATGAVNALRRVFEIRFAGIAESLSKTFRGALSNVQDFTNAVVRLASEKSFDTIRNTLVNIASGATNLATAFSDAAEGTSISSRIFKKYLVEDLGGTLDAGVKRFVSFLGFLNKFKAQLFAAVSLTVGPFLAGRIGTSFVSIFKGFTTGFFSTIGIPQAITAAKTAIRTGLAEISVSGANPATLLERTLLTRGIQKTATGAFSAVEGGAKVSKVITRLAGATDLALATNAATIAKVGTAFKLAGEAATATFTAIKTVGSAVFSLFKFSFINAVFEIIGAFDDLRQGIENTGRVQALRELVKTAQETERLVVQSLNNIVSVFVENFDAEKAGPFISLTNIFLKGLNSILSVVEKLTGSFNVLYRAVTRPFKAAGTFIESVGEIVTSLVPGFDRTGEQRAEALRSPFTPGFGKTPDQKSQDTLVGGIALGAGIIGTGAMLLGSKRTAGVAEELKLIKNFFYPAAATASATIPQDLAAVASTATAPAARQASTIIPTEIITGMGAAVAETSTSAAAAPAAKQAAAFASAKTLAGLGYAETSDAEVKYLLKSLSRSEEASLLSGVQSSVPYTTKGVLKELSPELNAVFNYSKLVPQASTGLRTGLGEVTTEVVSATAEAASLERQAAEAARQANLALTKPVRVLKTLSSAVPSTTSAKISGGIAPPKIPTSIPSPPTQEEVRVLRSLAPPTLPIRDVFTTSLESQVRQPVFAPNIGRTPSPIITNIPRNTGFAQFLAREEKIRLNQVTPPGAPFPTAPNRLAIGIPEYIKPITPFVPPATGFTSYHRLSLKPREIVPSRVLRTVGTQAPLSSQVVDVERITALEELKRPSSSGTSFSSSQRRRFATPEARADFARRVDIAEANYLDRSYRDPNIRSTPFEVAPKPSLLSRTARVGGFALGAGLSAYSVYTTQEEVFRSRASTGELTRTDVALNPLMQGKKAKPNGVGSLVADTANTLIATALVYFGAQAVLAITKTSGNAGLQKASANFAVKFGAGISNTLVNAGKTIGGLLAKVTPEFVKTGGKAFGGLVSETIGKTALGKFVGGVGSLFGKGINNLVARFAPEFLATSVATGGLGKAIGDARISQSLADRYGIINQLQPKGSALADFLGIGANFAVGSLAAGTLAGTGVGATVALPAGLAAGYVAGKAVTSLTNKLLGTDKIDEKVVGQLFPGLNKQDTTAVRDILQKNLVDSSFEQKRGFAKDTALADTFKQARDVVDKRLKAEPDNVQLKDLRENLTQTIDNLRTTTDPLAVEGTKTAQSIKAFDLRFGIEDETKRRAERNRREARAAAGRAKPGDRITLRDRFDDAKKNETTLRTKLEEIESDIVKASLAGQPTEALQKKKEIFRTNAIDARIKNIDTLGKIIKEVDTALKENADQLDTLQKEYAKTIEEEVPKITATARTKGAKFKLDENTYKVLSSLVENLLVAEPKQRDEAQRRLNSFVEGKFGGKDSPEAIAILEQVYTAAGTSSGQQTQIQQAKDFQARQGELSRAIGMEKTNIIATAAQEVNSIIAANEAAFAAGIIGISEKYETIKARIAQGRKLTTDPKELADFQKMSTENEQALRDAVRGRGTSAEKMNNALEETFDLSKKINSQFEQFGNASNAINLDTSLRQARLFNGLLAKAVENTDQFTKLENQRNEALGKAVDSYTKIIELRRKDIELVTQITRQQEEVAATTQFVAQTEALRKRGEALSPGTTEEDLTRFKTQSERISKEIARIQSRDADEAAQRRFRASIATMRQEVAGANADNASISSFRQALADRFNAPGLADMSQDERMAIDSRNAETLLKAQELAQQRVAELQNQILDSQQKRFSNQVRFNELLREEKQIRADIVKAENDRVKSAEAYFRSFSRAVTGNENIGLGNEEKLFQTDFTTQISGVNQLFQAGAFKKDIRDALKEASDTVSAAREKGINVGTQVQQLIDANQRLNTLPEDQNPLLVRAAQTRADRNSLQRDIATEEERMKRLINQRNAAQGILTEVTSLTLEQRAQVRRNVAERNPDRQARLALSNMTDSQIFNNAANVFSKAVDKFKESFSFHGGIDAASKKAFTGNQLRLQTDKPADAVLGKQNVSPTLAITSDMSGALLQPGKTVSNLAETLSNARDIVTGIPRDQAATVIRNTAPGRTEADSSNLNSSASYLSEAAKELKRVAEALKAGDASKLLKDVLEGINNMPTNRKEKDLLTYVPPPAAISATRLQESSFSQFMLMT